MKLRYLAIIAFLAIVACKNSDSKTENGGIAIGDSAKIVFKKTNHDFGTITEGDTVSTVYEFENKGSMPLEIKSVNVSCGCTVAEKPEKPIGAGQTGKIKVRFNSEGKAGVNKKFVTVISNASNSNEVVSFNVTVNKKN